MNRALATIALLILSNTFMTLAWYGHIAFKSATVPAAVSFSPERAAPHTLCHWRYRWEGAAEGTSQKTCLDNQDLHPRVSGRNHAR